jgi:hypothetical protein
MLLAIVLVAAFATACRQPDGTVPALDDQTTNRISDLGRDLQAVARGESDAKKAFADDLAVFADEDEPETLDAVRGFAVRLGDALVSAKLNDQSAEQIAQTSWKLVGATELSDRQVKGLQGELRSQLTSVGTPQDRADAVVAEMPTVQRAVTTRPRRWFEVF